MAYYEFECQKCGKQFEVNQSFSEHDRDPNPKCPHCKSKKVEQLISDVHVQTSKKS